MDQAAPSHEELLAQAIELEAFAHRVREELEQFIANKKAQEDADNEVALQV